MKVWWGIGAAALSLVLILFVWLPMFDDLPTVERLSAKEAAAGIEVPVIGTVGDFPEPKHRHVVNVTSDGRVEIDGRTFATYWQAVETLRSSEKRDDQGMPVGPHDAAVLRIDGDLPWSVAMWLWSVCFEAQWEPVCFVVRHEEDRLEGALTLPRPRQWSGSLPPLAPVSEKLIDVFPGDESVDPADLFAALRRAWAPPAQLPGSVVFRLDARARTADVLVSLDAAIRGGTTFTDWQIDASAPEQGRSGSFAEEARRLAGSGRLTIHVDGRAIEVTRPRSPMPQTSRVRGVALAPKILFGPDDYTSVPRPLPAPK